MTSAADTEVGSEAVSSTTSAAKAAWITSALSIITAPIGGRPPWPRSDRVSAASRSGRNIPKSTTAGSRSSGSPLFDRARYRSSRSKHPGCPDIRAAIPDPRQ